MTRARGFITIVSGLPRSGTSLVMQMLQAGGMPVVTDERRTADPDNPRGYFEDERVKHLRDDASWLAHAAGHAVKVIHMLLQDLPLEHDYRVLFVERDPAEVIRSQSVMLRRRGRPGAGLPDDRLREVFAQQVAAVRRHLAVHPCFRVLDVRYADVVGDPAGESARIGAFLGGGLDLSAMATAVDPALWRNRASSEG
ncbi:MAG: sulfotransferase [Phycisphaeraceae bacterium]|nr:sulfotransferase [Phycisphaeraceae bacterium]